jgi:hypothetical protein
MPYFSEERVALGAIIAFAIWLFVALPFLYGPNELQRPVHKSHELTTPAPTGKPDGSEAAPLFVQIKPNQKTAEERAQEIDDREEKRSADRWLVRWTAALFAATVGLILATVVLGYFGYRQSRDMRETIGVANRSADISERALTELEAPFTSIFIQESGLSKKTTQMGHDFSILKFTIVNHGRTPARLIELVDKTCIVPLASGNPPEINLDFRSRNSMPWGVIAPPNDGQSQPFTRNLLAEHMNELAEGTPPLAKGALFFYGFVRYETIFAQTYRMGFCFIYDKFSDRWLLSGDQRYNYLEREPSE